MLRSRVARYASVVCLLLTVATVAGAQTFTVNGSSGAMTVYRGAALAVTAGSGSTSGDWVGLHAVGAGHTTYVDWWYLNGTKSQPGAPVANATFTFAINKPPGAYELRKFANNGYTQVGSSSSVITVSSPLFTINGVAAPESVTAAPSALAQIGVNGGPGHAQDWVGIFRLGAADGAFVDWAYLNGLKSVPSSGLHTAAFTLRMPIPRGPYEFRWFHMGGIGRIATSGTVHSEVRTIAAGGDGHTLIVRPDGTVRASGLNNAGQLGDDTTMDKTTPIQVPGVSTVVSVAAGVSHSMALTASGAVYTWGANSDGQIGDGTNTPRLTPTLLSSLTEVVAIAAGEHHSVALTAAGQVFTWGENGDGQLGTGSTTDANAPVQIASGVVAIAAGDRFTVYVKTDGSVWGTGNNAYGALGWSLGSQTSSPVQMYGVTNAAAVRAGKQHSLILLNNGGVLATGRNHAGQLGMTGSDRWTAQQISTLSNIVDLAAGDHFSLALDKDGLVWSFGDNASGQLGVSTPSSRSTPEAVTGLSAISAIAAGGSHAVAIDANGIVFTFGQNSAGQLGHGSTTSHSAPTSSTAFSWRVGTPTLSVGSGTYEGSFNVTVTAPTDGSTMRYTQNGSDPTEADPSVASGSTIAIAQPQTLKVKAWKSSFPSSAVAAATYQLRVATPTFSPGTGTYSAATSVTLSSTTSGATVRYTLDGSDPTAASTAYTTPIVMNTGGTIKAAAFKSSWADSNVGSSAYTFNFGTLAAPTVDPAAGSYTSTVTVTMSSPQSGAVVRFTTNGDTPTASSAVYGSPVSVDGATTVKAKAFHPDYTTSAETSRTYALAAAPPTISPSSGTFTSAQDVSITAAASPAATLRYTTDGSDPTETSPAYTTPFSISTGTTVKARAFPTNGWLPSAVASAALLFNYGTLAAPSASPAGGVYATAQAITLSGAAGITIRYSLDGSEPSAASSLYETPIQVSSGNVTIKARAFHSDWSASPVRADVYVVDSTLPTITSNAIPSAQDGWHSTALTMNFYCDDGVAVASCSPPVSIDAEGAGTVITGTAVDSAGNQRQLGVTVNVDLTPPLLTLISPVDGLITTNSTVQITGTVADSLSGVLSVRCNGTSAPLVDGQITCTVPLQPGRNSIALTAFDVARNSASIGVTVTRLGSATRLVLTPSLRRLLVQGSAVLSLTDEFGSSVSGATWTSSDSSVVSVSLNDPPLLTAVAPGTVTISATKAGLSASAQLTVLDGITSPPDGTVLWEARNVGAGPLLYASQTFPRNPNEPTPAIFVPGSVDGQNFIWALNADGRHLSTHDALGPSAFGFPMMADVFGGVVKPVFRPNYYASSWGDSLARFAGPPSAPPWRYESPGILGAPPAQAPDGTIYVLERLPGTSARGQVIWDWALAIINGDTGRLRKRVMLPRNLQIYEDNRSQVSMTGCSLTPDEYDGAVSNLVVADNGLAYVSYRDEQNHVKFNGSSHCGVVFVRRENTIRLMAFSPEGLVSTRALGTGSTTSCGNLPIPWRLIPDVNRGVIATTVNSNLCTGNLTPDRFFHVDSMGNLSTHANTEGLEIELTSSANRVFLMPFEGSGTLTAKQLSTWSTEWTTAVNGRPTTALADGSVVMSDGVVINRGGTIVGPTPLSGQNVASVVRSGEFNGTRYDATLQQSVVTSEAMTISSKAEKSFGWGWNGAGNFMGQGTFALGCFTPPPHPDFLGFLLGSSNTFHIDLTYAPPPPQKPATLWTLTEMTGVRNAFGFWNFYNAATMPAVTDPAPINTSFTEFQGTPTPENQPSVYVRKEFIPPDSQTGLIPAGQVAGNIPQIHSSWTGVLNGRLVIIRLNTDPTVLLTFDGYLKVSIHEVGHILGLGEAYEIVGNPPKVRIAPSATTVMNPSGGLDDVQGLMAHSITLCDQRAARVHPTRIWPPQ